MEALEGAAPPSLFQELKYECPHKHDQVTYPPREEDLDSSERDEAAEAENHDTHNSSKKLGASLTAKSIPRVDTSTDVEKKVKVEGYKPVTPGETEFAYTVAAHHCIPGNASLKVSTITKYVSKSKGTIVENIGYNVNSADNGIWLPGWYAVRGTNTPAAGSGWGALGEVGSPFREEYVKAVIRYTGGQFHDTHPVYSDKVKDVLDKVALKLDTNGQFFCDECKKAAEVPGGKLPPPYGLKDRMDSLSAFLAGSLRGTSNSSWKLNTYCTSTTWKGTMEKM